MRNTPVWKSVAVSGALLLALAGVGCTATQTEEGKLPDVNVTTKEGNMPKYDVDVADVDVKTETKTVEVPDVDVKTVKTDIKVPDVDVTMPGEKKTP